MDKNFKNKVEGLLYIFLKIYRYVKKKQTL